jgi:hypothetical protein
MPVDSEPHFSAGHCDGCGIDHGALVKFSMGKDFFGRPYDRLSPAFDHSPKWYCERCSMQKTLQRDFRDIRSEFDKLRAGHESAFTSPDELQRAHTRLGEITTVLSDEPGESGLIAPGDVVALVTRINGQTASPSSAG